MEKVRDFMCSCGPHKGPNGFVKKYDEESKKFVETDEKWSPNENQQRCIDVLESVKARLGADDSNLLTRVVSSLHWEFAANINAIYTDQWSGIAAKTWADDDLPDVPRLDVWVECDEVEDGIARVWQIFADATEGPVAQ